MLVLDNLERAHARAAVGERARVAGPGAPLFAVFNPGERPRADGDNRALPAKAEQDSREQIVDLLFPWRIVAEATDEHALRTFLGKLGPSRGGRSSPAE